MQMVAEDEDGVFLQANVISPEESLVWNELQGDFSVQRRGGHDVTTHFEVYVSKFACQRWISTSLPMDVEIQGGMWVTWNGRPHLSIDHPLGYMVPKSVLKKTKKDEAVVWAEAFTGGFSGWSQALNYWKGMASLLALWQG